MTEIDRFMAYVSPEPNTGCWLWTGGTKGGRTGNRYSLFCSQNKEHYAHRRAVELFRCVDVTGKLVTHACDVKACVNPDHLEIGSHQTNLQEAWDRGLRRSRKGKRWGEV